MPAVPFISSDNFSRLLSDPMQPSGQWALIYFCASWCQPCKSMQPIYLQLTDYFSDNGTHFGGRINFGGSIHFGIVDIAQSPTIAPQYGIKSVPSIALFHDSRLVDLMAGEYRLSQLITQIENRLLCSH
ncbi:thioredoxin family protein [Providencia sp. PROV188]|nr:MULTISPECIES: thioredoxin family protein [unclassified Providencia]MTC25054.1 thioredoxin [Providencia sp. wls1938]MTC47129.1 thioredoxin [Providencia sp. wls1922]WBM61525.1 thioredoxin family protein [Providencia sp. PROV188]